MEMSDIGSFVIIAPATASCGKTKCGSVPACQDLRDLYTALVQSRENRKLHPALAAADFDRVGVLGHSMGAKHAPTFVTAHPDANIKALVASHGGDANQTALSALGVPAMFTTTADDTSSDRQPQIYNAFNSAASVHKVFARLATGGHQEPRTAKGGQLGEMTSYFLSGHVNLNDEHKARIYGTGPSTLCGGSIEFAGPASENCVVCETSSSCPKLTPPSSRQGLGDFLRKGRGLERDSACMCGSSACVCPGPGGADFLACKAIPSYPDVCACNGDWIQKSSCRPA